MMINQCHAQPPSPRIAAVFILAACFCFAPPCCFLAQAQAPAPPPSPPVPARRPPPIHHLYFDPRIKTFDDLRAEIRRLVIAYSITTPYNPQQVMQRYVLGARRLDFFDEPPAWIYIHVVVGETPQDKVTLAMAIDDLYLLGFSNGTDYWYKFSGGRSKSFKGLPEATVLPITLNYRDLIDGGYTNLYKVPLGNKSAIHATRQLATYARKITQKSQLQDGLVRFVAMMCEGIRYRDIWETFSGNNWDTETFMSKDFANSVDDWGDLSRLVIRWELTRRLPTGAKWGALQGKYKELADQVKVNSKVDGIVDAAKKLDFMVRPKETVPTY